MCGGLPARAGIGLKSVHVDDLLFGSPDVGFVEVHAENYMGAGGPPHAQLARIRERYAVSLHGVGLSIGGVQPLDDAHLDRLAALIERYRPGSFSEHLAWSSHDAVCFPDLLPVTYDASSLARVSRHIDQVQERLRCRMLLENPSTYVSMAASSVSEIDFLSEIVRRTGCGLLLDVNNVHVSAINNAFDPIAYLDAFPMHAVRELHLGGHAEDIDSLGDRLLIDAHDRPVAPEVWDLYRHVMCRTGPLPTLIEWDNDVPDLSVLLAEAARADAAMAAAAAGVRGAA
jgi:hypothetical protein